MPRGAQAILAALAATVVMASIGSSPVLAATPLAIGVSRNHLVDATGTAIRLVGVNRSGGEFACIQGWGVFDGPSDAASIAAMAAWHINAVRVPLNEDCWLAINGVSASYGGALYQSAIQNYVNLLHQYRLYAILDLHWSAPGFNQATGQQPMLDADHGTAFWSSVGTVFQADPAVLFDIYNEPHGISWSCWLNGCSSPGWRTAGMQSLVDAIRSSGATQPIMLGGLNWANDLGGWLAYKPADPGDALVASFHNYNFNSCFASCWSSTIAAAAAPRPPLAAGSGAAEFARARTTRGQ